MRVKCVKIFNEHTKQHQDISSWLTIGKEYVVLSIHVYSDIVMYNIINDNSNQSPGSHDAIQFEVVSHRIPSNWRINPGTLNLFTLGPKAWEQENFWDRCYEGDPEAIKVYKSEATIIMSEEDNVRSIFR